MLDWLLNWQHQNCRSRQRCWCGRELASARAGFALTPWAAEGGVIVHVPPLPVDHLCVCPPVLLQCTVVQVVTLAGMQHSTFPGTAVCKVGSQPGAHATHWHGLPGTRSGARARCSVSAHGLVPRQRENTLHHHTDLYHNISGTKSMDDTSSRASQRAGRSARDHTRQRSTSFVQPQVCGLCVHCLPSLSALLIESPALQRWCGPQTWSSSAVC